MLFSLVIEFDARRPDLNTLVQTIKRSKFAGGHILEFGKIQDFKTTPEDALAQISSGFLIHDRNDLLTAYQKAYQVNTAYKPLANF